MKNHEDYFNLLRKINNKPKLTHRGLAKELGYSLGKLNYCLKELKNKGLIKIKHFNRNLRRSRNKADYLYMLTTKGISQKTKLTLSFMKKKMKEYDKLREEMEKDK